MRIYLGVEDVLGGSGVVALGFPGVFDLLVPGLAALSFPAHRIPGDVDSVFPGLVSLGSSIYIHN